MKSVGLLLVCLMAVGAGVNGASVEMFQNGIGSYNGVDDTTLMSDAAEYDCGDFNLYAGDDVGDDRKILIRFGGLDELAGVSIESARLVLESLPGSLYFSQGSGTSFELGLYQIGNENADWVEGPGPDGVRGTGDFGIVGIYPAADWKHKDHNGTGEAKDWAGGENGCDVSGVDYVSVATDTLTVKSEGTFEFDLDANLVSQWANGGVNAGVIVKKTNVNEDGRLIFYSSESSTVSVRPKLIVELLEVNYFEFSLIVEQWLSSPSEPSADVAPNGGDGVVNLLDFASFAANNRLLHMYKLSKGESDLFGAEFNPTGEPIGGGVGYSDVYTTGDYVVSTKSELLSALNSAVSGDVIFVTGQANINLTGESNIMLGSGVTLASDRGYNGSFGGRLYVTSPTNLFEIIAPNVRITGLRMEGNDPDVGTEPYNPPISNCIHIKHPTTEVDNCEIWAWSYCGIRCDAGGDDVYPYIHHNYIHHSRRTGLGYGVLVYVNSAALIEANIIENCRHDVAASGGPDCSYEMRYNIIGKDATHYMIDMHGDSNNDGGKRVKIHHNSFYGVKDYYGTIHLEGVPVEHAWIFNNWFVGAEGVSIQQRPDLDGPDRYGNFINMTAMNNSYTSDEWGNLDSSVGVDSWRSADFNGDDRHDLIRFVDNGGLRDLMVRLSNDSIGFDAESVWGSGTQITFDRYKFADFNGDGRDDVLSIESDGNFYIWQNNGSGTGFVSSSRSLWGSNASGDLAELTRYKIGDVNGDGKCDMVSFETDGNIYVWLSTGSAFASKSLWASAPSDLGGFSYMVRDVTGDGRCDVVSFQTDRKTYVRKANATGDGFESDVVWASNGLYYPPIRHKIEDVDCDGKMDMLTMETNGMYKWFSYGMTFGSGVKWFDWQ